MCYFLRWVNISAGLRHCIHHQLFLLYFLSTVNPKNADLLTHTFFFLFFGHYLWFMATFKLNHRYTIVHGGPPEGALHLITLCFRIDSFSYPVNCALSGSVRQALCRETVLWHTVRDVHVNMWTPSHHFFHTAWKNSKIVNVVWSFWSSHFITQI